MNQLTDWDGGWWPLLRLRPAKDRDIDNVLLLKISALAGPVTGAACYLLPCLLRGVAISPGSLAGWLFGGFILFFIIYKATFAYFWNRRARRLRGATA